MRGKYVSDTWGPRIHSMSYGKGGGVGRKIRRSRLFTPPERCEDSTFGASVRKICPCKIARSSETRKSAQGAPSGTQFTPAPRSSLFISLNCLLRFAGRARVLRAHFSLGAPSRSSGQAIAMSLGSILARLRGKWLLETRGPVSQLEL